MLPSAATPLTARHPAEGGDTVLPDDERAEAPRDLVELARMT
jgi:hypothetical protein